MKRSGLRALWLAAAVIAGAAGGRPALAEDVSLYQKFGEKPGIDRIAADVTDRWVADPRIGETFDNINLDRFKRLLAISSASCSAARANIPAATCTSRTRPAPQCRRIQRAGRGSAIHDGEVRHTLLGAEPLHGAAGRRWPHDIVIR